MDIVRLSRVSVLHLLAVCLLLTGVGCAEKKALISDTIEGCRVECAVCVALDMTCLEQAKGVESASEVEVVDPTKGIRIIGPQGEMMLKPRKQP